MSSAGTPVCFRHPDRSAFVSCQRCDRKICPECQTPAAVGVICPECVARERRETPRVVATARRRSNRSAPVTLGIVALTLLVYVGQLIPGLGLTNFLAYAGVYSMPEVFEPWRMFTAVLVHSTSFVLHIVLNMYTLWIFGRVLEPLIG
ncbi:MAG: rhomboid family intramembrane serine protease [Agromyces sp.]